jgi:hypothetical protein
VRGVNNGNRGSLVFVHNEPSIRCAIPTARDWAVKAILCRDLRCHISTIILDSMVLTDDRRDDRLVWCKTDASDVSFGHIRNNDHHVELSLAEFALVNGDSTLLFQAFGVLNETRKDCLQDNGFVSKSGLLKAYGVLKVRVDAVAKSYSQSR